MDIRKKVGDNVYEKRKQKRMTQERLALVADLNRTYIISIESGKRNPSVKVLEKISVALQIDIKELFD